MATPLPVTSGGVAGVAATVALSVATGLEQAASASAAPTTRKRMTFIWGLNGLSCLSGPGVDRQGMDVLAHQFRGGSIDHPVHLHLSGALEGRGGDGHVEMAALARAGMADVLVAVVA